MYKLTKQTSLAIGVACGLMGPMEAQTFLTSANWDSTNAELGENSSGQLSGTTSASRSFQSANGRNSGNVRAEAAPGVLRASAGFSLGNLVLGEGLTSDPQGGAYRALSGDAWASFSDTMTVVPSNPALMGTEGRVRFSIDVTGRMQAGHGFHSGSAIATWFIGGTGAFVSDPVRGEQIMPFLDLPFSGKLDYDVVNGQIGVSHLLDSFGQVETTSYGANTDGRFITFDLPVYLGTPFTIGLDLSVVAGVTLEPVLGREDTLVGSAHALADFGNTARLVVTTVFDGSGLELEPSAFALNTDSGYQYAAVPEPNAVALMTGSALLVGAWWRRHRRVHVSGDRRHSPC
jgi:hypothetical protein